MGTELRVTVARREPSRLALQHAALQSAEEVKASSFPMCIDWLPDGRLRIVSASDGLLLRREPDGSLVTPADLTGLADHKWNDIVADGRGNAYVAPRVGSP